MSKIFDLLEDAMNYGVEVTVTLNTEGQLVHNLNTGAKSSAELVEVDGVIWAYGRYGTNEVIEDIPDLYSFVDNCKCGRDYMNQSWVDVIREFYERF